MKSNTLTRKMIKYFIIYSFCLIFSSGYLFRVFFRLQCNDKCSDIKLDGERVLNNKDIVPITLENYNFPFYLINFTDYSQTISFSIYNKRGPSGIKGYLISRNYYISTNNITFWNKNNQFVSTNSDNHFLKIKDAKQYSNYKITLNISDFMTKIKGDNFDDCIKGKITVKGNTTSYFIISNIIPGYVDNTYKLKWNNTLKGTFYQNGVIQNSSYLISNESVEYRAPSVSCKDYITIANNNVTERCILFITINVRKKYTRNGNNSFSQTENSKEELLDIIDTSVVDLVDPNTTIKGSDFYLQVYSSNDLPKENGNVSSINFSECEKAIRKHNEIPESDLILISKFDYINSTTTVNKVEYKIFDKDGNPLSLEPCNKIPIDISYPINPKKIQR